MKNNQSDPKIISLERSRSLDLAVNKYVLHMPSGKKYRITKQIDFTQILGEDEEGRHEQILLITDLTVLAPETTPYCSDLAR
ncbi:hypothetical protein [Neisseria musculi]|uniref:hypothetical protein n=1 Tax=Neisseria musculi TaxID=1815583 RepID=UPI00164C6032|nr:hypothetical protein [Neisseria musculi]